MICCIVLKPKFHSLKNFLSKFWFLRNNIKVIEERGLVWNHDMVGNFYIEHKEKDFFPSLLEYLSGQSVVAWKVELDDIDHIRKLIGDTDPKKAEVGTIRYQFGINVMENVIHCSANSKDGERECKLIFQ